MGMSLRDDRFATVPLSANCRFAFRTLRDFKQDGGRDFASLEPHFAFPFDTANFAALIARNKGGCGAALSGPASSSDAMHEVVRSLREVEIYHMRNAVDVNASGGYIGCD